MADPAGLQDSAIQVHYEQRDAQGRTAPASVRALPSIPGCGVGTFWYR